MGSQLDQAFLACSVEGMKQSWDDKHLMAVAAMCGMRYDKAAGAPRFANTPSKPEQKFYAIDKFAEVNYRPKALALVEDLSSNRRDLRYTIVVLIEGIKLSRRPVVSL